MSILLAAGADPGTTDNHGRSASDLIAMNSHLTGSRWKLSTVLHRSGAPVQIPSVPLASLPGETGCDCSPAPPVALQPLPSRLSLRDRRRPNHWSDLHCDSPIVISYTPPTSGASASSSSGQYTTMCYSPQIPSVPLASLPDDTGCDRSPAPPIALQPLPSRFSLRRPDCWSDLHCDPLIVSAYTPPMSGASSSSLSGKRTTMCDSAPCESVDELPMACELACDTPSSLSPVPRTRTLSNERAAAFNQSPLPQRKGGNLSPLPWSPKPPGKLSNEVSTPPGKLSNEVSTPPGKLSNEVSTPPRKVSTTLLGAELPAAHIRFASD
jgi:hypothetical protein